MKRLLAAGGTYTLFFRNSSDLQLQFGSLGLFVIEPGILINVGSAFGPGGLCSRISHHLRVCQNPRWHVDGLRSRISPVEVWYSVNPLHHEHPGASVWQRWEGVSNPVLKIGATDCSCQAHLFLLKNNPVIENFGNRLRKHKPNHLPLKSLGFSEKNLTDLSK